MGLTHTSVYHIAWRIVEVNSILNSIPSAKYSSEFSIQRLFVFVRLISFLGIFKWIESTEISSWTSKWKPWANGKRKYAKSNDSKIQFCWMNSFGFFFWLWLLATWRHQFTTIFATLFSCRVRIEVQLHRQSIIGGGFAAVFGILSVKNGFCHLSFDESATNNNRNPHNCRIKVVTVTFHL